MSWKIVLIILVSFLYSCGSYKQLKPKPEIVPRESEYIQISQKDKVFQLKSGKRYFIEFPTLMEDNYYLVVRVENLSQFNAYLTDQFDKNPKTPDPALKDQSGPADNYGVYEISARVPAVYWVIDGVRDDAVLKMEYRYVPIWRFRFEQKYAQFQTTLAKNKADRQKFEAIGISINARAINYEQDLADLQQKSNTLSGLQRELAEIAAIFPPGIKNSDDRAYLDYVALKREVDEEIKFQEDYRRLLSVLQKTQESRFNKDVLVQNLPEFLSFFENEQRYPENVRREVKGAVAERLEEIVPYYENQVRRKRDVTPIDFPARSAENLYRKTGKQPDARFQEFSNFVERFNRDVDGVRTVQSELANIRAQIRKSGSWPSDNFFSSLRAQLGRLRASLPTVSPRAYGRYANYPVAASLEATARELGAQLDQLQQSLDIADRIAPQINQLRDQGDYRGIIRMLKEYRGIDFLMEIYADADQKYIDQRTREIEQALTNQQWAAAEQRIRELYETRDLLNYEAFAARKLELSKAFEERLATAVEQNSRERINAFIRQNQGAIDNVEALYNSEAFRPVYQLTFSAGGQNVVDRLNKRIQDYLDGFKFDQFPKSSIETIYNDFIRDPLNNGVAKARAIITHGKYYKGNDRRIKNMVAEVDPSMPKLISKPTEYRRIFVLPTNAVQQKDNTYTFRVNLKLPSEANFPVFDVNIKLPREVAKSADSQPWYDSITFNKKLLKSEGRFTITAPTERNNFECQITPLQVNKEGDNILEVNFRHAAFKVLEVSVMAQRPIIRRD